MLSEVLGSLQYSITKSSEVCQTRGLRDCAYSLQDKGWDMAHALHWL
jgi:hypothetical protein